MSDRSEIRSQLEQSSSRISWLEIKIDILKEVIFLVDKNLDLLEVAEACALDNKAFFEKCLIEGSIFKPQKEQTEVWTQNNTNFNCCIVKPFMFLQQID